MPSKRYKLQDIIAYSVTGHIVPGDETRPWQSPGGGGGMHGGWVEEAAAAAATDPPVRRGFLRWNNRYAGLVVTAPVHVPVSSSCHVNVFVCFCVFVP
uniref:Uncharacterized protein n=1 Tax=Oryza nivara TaxID=4536 RepID=A0A0E0IA26_ORYNI